MKYEGTKEKLREVLDSIDMNNVSIKEYSVGHMEFVEFQVSYKSKIIVMNNWLEGFMSFTHYNHLVEGYMYEKTDSKEWTVIHHSFNCHEISMLVKKLKEYLLKTEEAR